MFGAITTFSAAALLLLLSAAAVRRKRSAATLSLAAGLFLLACASVLDQLALGPGHVAGPMRRGAMAVESLLPVTLLFYSLSYSREDLRTELCSLARIALVCGLLLPAAVLLAPVHALFLSPDLEGDGLLVLGTAGYWFYLGLMLYCIAALVNMESTFSSTPRADRGKIKFEVLGAGSILAVLIFFFSQGLLYRSINMSLLPVRSGVLIVGALLIGYSRFFRGNGVQVRISRVIVYRSLTLLLVGLYLLFLGLIGHGLRYYDVPYSRNVAIFLAFAAGLMLILVLLSEKLRRGAKVFIGKHFYSQKHDYREAWLKFTGRLAACKDIDDVYRAVLMTYTETFGLNSASLYLRDEGQRSYVPVAGPRGGEKAHLPATAGMVAYFLDRNRIFNPLDGEYRPDGDEAAFIRRSGARYIVPLISSRDVFGFVVFGGQISAEQFIFEDYDLMKTFARQAVLSIQNFRLAEELGQTREVAAVGKLSSFVIHDLKNMTSALSLAVENAREHMRDPDFQRDVIGTIRGTVGKIGKLMHRLRSLPEQDRLDREVADLHCLAGETVDEVLSMRPGATIAQEGEAVFSFVDRDEIKKVVINLLQNSLDAVDGQGAVSVETGRNGDRAYVRIRDTGCGMTPDFISTQLFRPFRTTKRKGLGIGLYQCRQIVGAHDGRIEVSSTVGQGTDITVFLPLAADGNLVTVP